MEIWSTTVHIKSTVLEIVHEIPEVTKLLASEENERNQVEEINHKEKIFSSLKGRQGARKHRWDTHAKKTP